MPDPTPWIRWIRDDEATGALARFYDAAIRRAGRVWNIVRVMSLRPETLEPSMTLYQSVMHRTTPRLPRATREMIAVAVSKTNACHY